jgi:hypothetical protein
MNEMIIQTTAPTLREKLKAVLERSTGNIAGVVASSVVDIETAEVLAGFTCREDFDIQSLSMAYSDLARFQMRAAEGLLGDQRTIDMLLTTDEVAIILRPVDDLMCLHIVVVERSKGVGLARKAMEAWEGEMTQVILGLK